MADQPVPASAKLLHELRSLIGTARNRLAQAVNGELVGVYRAVGKRLRTEVLNEHRAAYGEQVFAQMADDLTKEFGRGFSARNLRHMARFAELFPDAAIVNALRTQLSWTHFRVLISIEDPLKRQFYTEMCRTERWRTRALKRNLDGMLFERTAIAKRPKAVIEGALNTLKQDDRVSPDLVFRDPYVLDFHSRAFSTPVPDREPLHRWRRVQSTRGTTALRPLARERDWRFEVASTSRTHKNEKSKWGEQKRSKTNPKSAQGNHGRCTCLIQNCSSTGCRAIGTCQSTKEP